MTVAASRWAHPLQTGRLANAQVPEQGFIASPLYDAVFFLLAPLLSLGLVAVFEYSPWPPATNSAAFTASPVLPATFFILVWSHAHAVAVFFRSHANRSIFVQHRFAFTAVPMLLFLALMVSDWAMAVALVVAPFWAIYHIGMQNFGLGRLYDVRRGNPPEMGRHLDYGLHQFVNLAPFVAGWSLFPHLQSVGVFNALGWKTPLNWIDAHRGIEGALAGYLLVAGLAYLAYYLYAYRRLMKDGYRPSPQKIALLLVTGAVSVVSWGFLPAWQAVFVMNFFHGLQYFGLVWWIEHRNLGRVTRLDRLRFGTPLLLAGFVAFTLLDGCLFLAYGRNFNLLRWTASLALVISLMHYWYDGFVWSVSRREV